MAVRAVAIAAAAGWFGVNAHYQHRLAQLWGGGTLSSWDEQRFPLRARSLSARALWRYFLDECTTTYTPGRPALDLRHQGHPHYLARDCESLGRS